MLLLYYDKRLVSNMKKHLETFVEVTSAAKTRQAAIDKMKELFPGFAQEDFLLLHSLNLLLLVQNYP